jgi:hypothetical protein
MSRYADTREPDRGPDREPEHAPRRSARPVGHHRDGSRLLRTGREIVDRQILERHDERDEIRSLDRDIDRDDRSRDRERSTADIRNEVLADIGRFRAVDQEDFSHGQRHDDGRRERILEGLERAGLVRSFSRMGSTKRYLTLTRAGLERAREESGKDRLEARLYTSMKNPRELRHDAAVYRAYRDQVRRLEGQGRIRALRLDDELRRRVNRELAQRAKELGRPLGPDDVREVAKAHNVGYRDQSIEYPDLQLEVEMDDRSRATINIEVVTGHYREADIQAKLDAGFLCYTAPGDGARMRGRSLELAEELWDL